MATGGWGVVTPVKGRGGSELGQVGPSEREAPSLQPVGGSGAELALSGGEGLGPWPVTLLVTDQGLPQEEHDLVLEAEGDFGHTCGWRLSPQSGSESFLGGGAEQIVSGSPLPCVLREQGPHRSFSRPTPTSQDRES